MKEYLVKPVTTGFFSGSLSQAKFQNFLNEHARGGWQFVQSIHETTRVFWLFSREAHFIVFEKNVGCDDPVAELLRQLIRAYGHEPSA